MLDCNQHRCCEKCVGKFIETYKINEVSREEVKFDHCRYPLCPNCSTDSDDPHCHALEHLRLEDLRLSNIAILNGVDPVGNIIFTNNKVYRGIHKHFAQEYLTIFHICHQRGLFGHHIINTKIADDFSLEPFGLILEHELIWPYIYPFEWSLSMIIDAAYAVLNLVRKLDQVGLGLKDGHPFNSSYHKGMFYFIDFGSIIHQKTTLWMFKEFINTFINWIICKIKGIKHNKVLVEDEITSHLTNEEREQYNVFKTTILTFASSGEILKAIELLSYWINYYEKKIQITSYNSTIPNAPLYSIVKFINDARIKYVMVVSGNYSNLCFTLNQNNNIVTVFNEDPQYIDFIYSQIKSKETNISPALINFLNPNGPNDGSRWFNAEIRFSSEMIIVFNHFLYQTNFEELSRKLKLFTNKYAAIEIFDPPNESLIEGIKRDFNIIDITKEAYDGKKILFLKVK
ncbi:hypothetical protein [Pelosinus propionicus]|uniref:Uncharacterized protein n=1 Tax=Pelosinus propionicus DSM 13327 TaxID=1123291 RepID=A0A1I4PB79_9FIRM|nr:hypothetical protein [Pelosinus propionicus]SFM24880.1 hypothetical protein SAMN04490355_106034 [Pelosinus propionicus DSM 13327]